MACIECRALARAGSTGSLVATCYHLPFLDAAAAEQRYVGRTEMLIRRANLGDASGIAAVHLSAIRELCASAYETVQIDSWISGKRPEQYLEPIAQNPFFVALSGADLVGFSELGAETGEVRAVYVHPQHVRQGIGGRLLEAVEAAARERSLVRLHLHASLNSVPFYEAHSYVPDGKASVTLRDGTQLPCMAMHKQLDS